MKSSTGANFPWSKYWVRIGGTLAFMALPFAPPIWAKMQADAHGCQLHEGNVNPCIIEGVDQGELLYGLWLSGWLGGPAVAVGFIALIAWAVALYRELGRWGRN